MNLHFDTTSNLIKNPEVKKQIENSLKKDFEKDLPNIIKRISEIPSFMTTEVREYNQLLIEAKKCYEMGLYYATMFSMFH